MRFPILTLIIAILFLASCTDEKDGPRIVGSGTIVTEERTVSSFSSVDISGIADVNITYGTTARLTVSADDNIIELISTQVIQNKLFIQLENGNYDDITVNITLVNPTLQTVDASGANNVVISQFEDLDRLDVSISGVGNMEMSGSANELNIDNSGSTNLSGFDFTAETCQVDVSGVGNVQITVNQLLTGSLSGVGNILYKGPADVNVSVSGIGNVINSN